MTLSFNRCKMYRPGVLFSDIKVGLCYKLTKGF